MCNKKSKNFTQMEKQVNEINSVKRSDFTVIMSGADSDDKEIGNNEIESPFVRIVGTVYYKGTPVDWIDWKMGEDGFPIIMGTDPDSSKYPWSEDFIEEEFDEEEFDESNQSMDEIGEQLLNRYMTKILNSVYGSAIQDNVNNDKLLENFERLYCMVYQDESGDHILFGNDKDRLFEETLNIPSSPKKTNVLNRDGFYTITRLC